MDNIIDNLQTKDNLTYDDVHARLLDLNANHTLPKGKGEKAYRIQKSGTTDGTKECSWCKKTGFQREGTHLADL